MTSGPLSPLNKPEILRPQSTGDISQQLFRKPMRKGLRPPSGNCKRSRRPNRTMNFQDLFNPSPPKRQCKSKRPRLHSGERIDMGLPKKLPPLEGIDDLLKNLQSNKKEKENKDYKSFFVNDPSNKECKPCPPVLKK